MKNRKHHLRNNHIQGIDPSWKTDVSDPANYGTYYGHVKPDAKDYSEETRYVAYLERKQQGFDFSETWSLNYVIAKFVLPRLKYFKENVQSHPGNLTHEEWMAILDEIIWALEQVVEDRTPKDAEKYLEYYSRIQQGCELFGKWFQDLWD